MNFFLFTDTYAELHAAGYRTPTPVSPYNEDYHIFQTSKEEEVMRAIRTGLNAAGIPVENSKGEASAGQEEINVRYADALESADAHVIVKNAVKEIAWSKGRAVTFMAKYDHRAAGLVEPRAPVAVRRSTASRPSSTPARRTACRS